MTARCWFTYAETGRRFDRRIHPQQRQAGAVPHGDGSLSAPLEAQLLGLRAGDKCAFTLQPEAAFGAENPDLVQFFSRRDFAETGVPDVGTIMLFTAIDGSEMPGVVRAVAEDSITVDFNHPLAGHPVTFDIEVLEIDPQQEEMHANIAG